MLRITILQEVTRDRSEKSDISTLSNTGVNTTPEKGHYKELYTFKMNETDSLSVDEFISQASRLTATDMELADFKNVILRFDGRRWEEVDLNEDLSNLNDFGLVMVRKRTIKTFLKNISGDVSDGLKRSGSPNCGRGKSPKSGMSEKSHKSQLMGEPASKRIKKDPEFKDQIIELFA